jgi:hypothetical protein
MNYSDLAMTALVIFVMLRVLYSLHKFDLSDNNYTYHNYDGNREDGYINKNYEDEDEDEDIVEKNSTASTSSSAKTYQGTYCKPANFSYYNHCWKCKNIVTDNDCRCPSCGWFICSQCGACDCDFE